MNLAIVSGKKTFDAATYRAHDGVVSNHESDGMMEAEDLFAGLGKLILVVNKYTLDRKERL